MSKIIDSLALDEVLKKLKAWFDSRLSDLSLKCDGKVGKSGSVEKMQNAISTNSLDTTSNCTITSRDGRSASVHNDYNGSPIIDLPTNDKYIVIVDIYDASDRSRYALKALTADDRMSRQYSYASSGVYVDTDTDKRQRLYLIVDGTRYTNVHICNTAFSEFITYNITNLMVINLTEMFGAGNEPPSATEFANALGYDSIDDVPYIPYSANAITMPSVDNIGGLMMGKLFANEICLGEYTLRCNGSSLVAVDSSGNETTLLGGASTTSLDDATE